MKNPRKYDFVNGIYIILLQAKILVKFCLVIPQLVFENEWVRNIMRKKELKFMI
jgi:hypothetical protein